MEKCAPVKLVVFDFDGTIANLDVDWNSVKKELSRHFAKVYSYDSQFAPLYKELDRASLALGHQARRSAIRIIERYETQAAQDPKPLPDIIELIKYLRNRGIILAIFSSTSRRAVLQSLRRLGVSHLFKSVVALDDVTRSKPDPEGLNRIMLGLGFDRSETLFIGDKPSDLEAGKRAGICVALAANMQNFRSLS